MPTLLSSLRRLVPAPDSDLALMERFVAERDSNAFADIVDRHGPLVRGVCRRMLRDDHLADDAFQATFLTLIRRADSLRDPGAVSSWLFGVARRISLSLRRQTPLAFGDARQAAVQTEKQCEWAEMLGVLDEELARLPDRYRAPLIECYLHGRTQDEAAKRLGWSVMTLRRRLERGRELLRSRLTTRGVTLSAALMAGGLVSEAIANVSSALRQRTIEMLAKESVSSRVAALVPAAGANRVTTALVVGAIAGVGIALGAAVVYWPKITPTATVLEPRTEAIANAWDEPLPNDAIARLGTTAFRPGGSGPAVIVDPMGVRHLAFRDDDTLLSINGERVRNWDVQTGKELHAGRPAILTWNRWLSHCRLTSGNQILLPDSNEFAEALPQYSLWNVKTHQLLKTVKLERHPERKSAIIGPTAVAENVSRTLELDGNGDVWIWDSDGTAAGRIEERLQPFQPTFLSPDGARILSVERGPVPRLRVWDASSGRSIAGARPASDGQEETVMAACLSPDGRWLAAICSEFESEPRRFRSVRVWDTHADRPPAVLDWPSATGHEVQFARLAFSADSKTLAAFTSDARRIRFGRWSMESRERTEWVADARGFQPACLAVQRDGSRLAIGGDGAIRMFDATRGIELVPGDAHVSAIRRVEIDGAMVRTTDAAGEVRTWDGETGRLQSATTTPPPNAVRGAQIFDDHLLIGSRRIELDVCTILGSPKGKNRDVIPRSSVISADGSRLAVGLATRPTANELGRVGVIDLNTGALLWQAPLAESAPASLRFSRDGKQVAVGTTKVRVFESATGRPMSVFDGHRGAITALEFDADGTRLISGSEDTTAIVWRLPRR